MYPTHLGDEIPHTPCRGIHPPYPLFHLGDFIPHTPCVPRGASLLKYNHGILENEPHVEQGVWGMYPPGGWYPQFSIE